VQAARCVWEYEGLRVLVAAAALNDRLRLVEICVNMAPLLATDSPSRTYDIAKVLWKLQQHCASAEHVADLVSVSLSGLAAGELGTVVAQADRMRAFAAPLRALVVRCPEAAAQVDTRMTPVTGPPSQQARCHHLCSRLLQSCASLLPCARQ
jgi:hypothetical protein